MNAHTDAVLDAARALLADIQAMQTDREYEYGPLQMTESDPGDGLIEWPNLAISAQSLANALDTLDHTKLLPKA